MIKDMLTVMEKYHDHYLIHTPYHIKFINKTSDLPGFYITIFSFIDGQLSTEIARPPHLSFWVCQAF